MIRVALVLAAVAVLSVPTYVQTPKVPLGWKLADPDAQKPPSDAPTTESLNTEERINRLQVHYPWRGIIEGYEHFKQLSESGEIAEFPPRNPEEALLRLMWSSQFMPPVVMPALIDAYVFEWGDSCPRGLKWDGVISRDRWQELYRNGQLVHFPPRTMPEAMMRVSWIASSLGGRWVKTILTLYADLYRRGFADACASPRPR